MIFIQVDAGNQFEGRLAISHYYTDMLVILAGISFNGVGGTRFVGRIGFLWVDPALQDDFFHFRLCDLAAIHPAAAMLGIDQVGDFIRKSVVISRL